MNNIDRIHYGPRTSFFAVVTDAVADITEFGFDSEQRLTDWIARIRAAALADLTPLPLLEAELKRTLTAAYDRYVEKGGVARYHADIPHFTIDRVKPKLRAELDRRMAASAGLIKLNRAQAVERTTQRLAGWATSIPAGGSKNVDRVPVKSDIRKALVQLPYEERRIIIDQSYKLISSVSNIIANDGGAIAVEWHSHWRDKSYNFRPDHKIRDGHIYAIKGNWAALAGLMKPGPNGYYEDVTAFAQEPFCRCFGRYLYAIRRLPEGMLTQKGRETLALRMAA